MNFSTNRQLAYLPVCRWLALLLLTGALFFALSDSARAQATITVNTTTDEINNDGDCSLREAIESANTNFAVDACASGIGDDTILFEPALVAGGVQTINLTLFDTGLDSDEFGPTALTISSTLTIMGPSTNGITLTRGGVANFRLFRVTSNGSMTIVNLTLDNGVAAGGKGWGVLDGGAGGGGAAGMGGAIFNEGNVILENVTLRNNRALGGNGGFGGDGGTGNGGGGMGQDGVSGNDDINPGQGGGPNGGVGNIAAPTAGGNGGGGGGSGAFSADGGNGGFGGGGGGATGVGKTGGNGGFGGGGGGNRSDSGTTGLGGFGGGNSDRSAAGGGAGMGGAIFNRGGTVELLNTTVTANEAKGGDSISNVAGAGHGLGGAIFNLDGVLILQYSTFTSNAVSVGTGSAPRADGGAIFNKQLDTTATVSLGTSILANTANGQTDFYNDGGTVTGSQSNIVETNAADSNGAPSGLLIVNNGDPKLAPLANNGGPSLTHALLADSPAVDVSSDGVNGCGSDIISDQRGVARPLGAGCDSGAYEAPAAITIRGNGQLIADGDLTPTSIDHTDFGSILTTDGALSRTFTVQNTGVTALTLTSSPAVTLTNDTHFAVTQQPASVTIASGRETTFTIAFDPATAGTHLVTVFVANDAPNATPYTFAIRGTGVPPPLTCPVGGVLFVKVGGAGSQDGTSWDNAFATLQDALAVTNACEIWVANGVYYPDEGVGQTDNNRSATFQLKNDVAIYGGFVGTESQRTQRNWQGNLTVLSGDIDKNDTTDSNGVVANTANLSGANALHVVIGSDVTNTAVLDGFIVTAGWANNRDNTCLGECGGGMYNQTGHPTLRNLIFQANSATFGGGLYNMSNSHPTLTDITFRANSALIDGGGLINNGSNATLTNIRFESNAAANAGGLFNYLSTPLLNNLTFLTNTASNVGGGMVNRNSNPTLTDATFQANTASDGGGLYNYENSRPILSNLLFQTNSASLSGGGMLNDASNANLTNITFRANSAGYFGGGMFNSSSDPTLTNVIFEANMAEREGGGVDNYLSSPTLANVLFHANWAGLQGGGLLNFSDSNPTLTNVTFHANLAGIGGGIANRLASNPHLINTILWGNAISGTVQSTAQISNTADSTPVISYSLIEGSGGSGVSWQADLGSDGGNNLATDPLFVQNGSAASDPPTLGNVHLQSSSPAIDVGNSVAITLATDLDGNPRLQGSAVDMGAYETAKVISYTLSIAINGTGSGLITLNPPGEIYPAGTIVTVTATPNTGSNLEGWSGDCTDVGLCVVTVDANKAVTATFTLNQYNLITATIGNGNGVLTLDPPGGTYSHGTVVTVTAAANSGSTFAGWSGDCSGTDPCSVTMDASKAVTATFTLIPPNQYMLTTATSGSGSGVITLDPSGGIYTKGTVVTVTAAANSGSTFAGWSGDCSGTDPCSVTMDAGKAVTATFTLIPPNQYTLTTATSGSGSGVITLNPSGGIYTEGTVVTVTATANSGSTFTGWSGDCSGTDPCSMTMDVSKAVTATFTLIPSNQYTLTTATTGTGNGTITLNPPGGVYTEGTVVTVTASANLSSTFSGWSGACSGTDSCIVTMDANKVITADFTLVPTPRIAVSVEREGAGIVAPGTVVTYQVAITNVGQITVQLTSLQGTPQPVAQQLTAADTQALDAPCTAPITLAVGDVHRCTFTWTAAGNDGQQVNFIVTANGTANGQAATASGLAQVVIAAPTALDESGEPQPWRSYLPMVTKQ